VKKYADGDLSEQEFLKKKRGMIFKKRDGEIVDCWLEDMKLNRKDRRTNSYTTNTVIFEFNKLEYYI
jgi:hypothetical protein